MLLEERRTSSDTPRISVWLQSTALEFTGARVTVGAVERRNESEG
jgi:hypothetical protein